MHSDTRQVILGSVAELEMCGLTVPGLDGAKDPLAQVCISAADAFKLTLTILEKQWKLDTTTQAALLGVTALAFDQLRKGTPISLRQEQIDRITDLLRCYQALRVLLPNDDAANTWVSRPNNRFLPTPVVFMVQNGTKQVRQYLESELQG